MTSEPTTSVLLSLLGPSPFAIGLKALIVAHGMLLIMAGGGVLMMSKGTDNHSVPRPLWQTTNTSIETTRELEREMEI